MHEALHKLVAAHVLRWPGTGAAAVVSPSGVVASAGPLDLPFAWASVTKLLVALAALVAVEERALDLEESAGPPGSTFAHLLAHASGLPFEGHVPVAPPARRRIYSNTGIEHAASHLGQRAGMPFGDYLTAGVLEPLGMQGTTLHGSPAHGARGPLSDLARLAAELVSPSLVSRATWQRAVSVAWPGLVGVVPGFGRHDPCDWGLGPELRGHKWPHWTGRSNSPATYGHFGQSGSFVWVDPAAGIGLCGLCSTAFGPWAKQAWPVLSDAVLRRGQTETDAGAHPGTSPLSGTGRRR
ncbi:MAG: serine hydrolase [Acidimicrobiales bacterium]